MGVLRYNTEKIYRAVVNKDPAAVDRFALAEWNEQRRKEYDSKKGTWAYNNTTFVDYTIERVIQIADNHVGRIYSDKRNATTQRNQARRATHELVEAWVEEGEITWKRMS